MLEGFIFTWYQTTCYEMSTCKSIKSQKAMISIVILLVLTCMYKHMRRLRTDSYLSKFTLVRWFCILIKVPNFFQNE